MPKNILFEFALKIIQFLLKCYHNCGFFTCPTRTSVINWSWNYLLLISNISYGIGFLLWIGCISTVRLECSRFLIGCLLDSRHTFRTYIRYITKGWELQLKDNLIDVVQLASNLAQVIASFAKCEQFGWSDKVKVGLTKGHLI